MEFIDKAMDIWKDFCRTAEPTAQKVTHFMGELADAFRVIWRFATRMRKVILAIPVGWGAVYLAIYNQSHLPAVVGLSLENNGELTMQVARELAVLGPMALTALCLLLMFGSRRVLTPWLVSLFSLAIPLVILVANVFPA